MSGCDSYLESLKITVSPSFDSPEDLGAVFTQCDANKGDQELNGSPGYFDRLVADDCFRRNTYACNMYIDGSHIMSEPGL
jgi:hypothetical protein